MTPLSLSSLSSIPQGVRLLNSLPVGSLSSNALFKNPCTGQFCGIFYAFRARFLRVDQTRSLRVAKSWVLGPLVLPSLAVRASSLWRKHITGELRPKGRDTETSPGNL